MSFRRQIILFSLALLFQFIRGEIHRAKTSSTWTKKKSVVTPGAGSGTNNHHHHHIPASSLGSQHHHHHHHKSHLKYSSFSSSADSTNNVAVAQTNNNANAPKGAVFTPPSSINHKWDAKEDEEAEEVNDFQTDKRHPSLPPGVSSPPKTLLNSRKTTAYHHEVDNRQFIDNHDHNHDDDQQRQRTMSSGTQPDNHVMGLGNNGADDEDDVVNRDDGRRRRKRKKGSLDGGSSGSMAAERTDQHHQQEQSKDIIIDTWIFTLISASLVGLSGVLPLIVIPLEAGKSLRQGGAGYNQLKLFLSFAVGGLLGDVFLHLLPEAWNHGNSSEDIIWIGQWVLAGILSFLFIEKVMGEEEEEQQQKERTKEEKMKELKKKENTSKNPNLDERIKISGYLNLFANCVDNFTHGLAIAGSYLVSRKVGIITTIAILLHEIPHEVGDFAILLRAGFDRWKAAKAQLLTATGGLLGAFTALTADSAEEAGIKTAWILPFTAGGFIYIALVTIVPELVKEDKPRQSINQVLCICAGIMCMFLVTLVFE